MMIYMIGFTVLLKLNAFFKREILKTPCLHRGKFILLPLYVGQENTGNLLSYFKAFSDKTEAWESPVLVRARSSFLCLVS